MSPLIHSNVIRDEHKRYLDNFEKLINKRLNKSYTNLSYEYYKMSYSIFVLVTELIKRRQGSVYLRELKTEIVSLIGLGTIGFENSLHLRRCIELSLKHVYYIDHPIEYQILSESIKSGELAKEDKIVKELFDYFRLHPNFKKSKKFNDPINLLDISYKKLCEIVHARKISTPSKLEECTIPKLTTDDIQQGKNFYRKIMRSIIVLLIIFHISTVAKFDEFKKEAILYSLTRSLSRNLRSELGI